MTAVMRVLAVEWFRRSALARLPFRFGTVTVRELALLDVRVQIDVGGRRVEGWAADCAVPRWFRKDASRSIEDDVAELVASVRAARECFLRHGAAERTLFALWWQVYRERVDALPIDHTARLVHGFGVALIERALIDAVCRAAEVGFHTALLDDRFGFEPAILRDDLRDFDLVRSLPERPLEAIVVRHTVGMLDPLEEHDIPDDDRIADGLPQSLAAVVASYGVTHFKIKIGQGVEVDRLRLRAIAACLHPRVAVPLVTLDGNERYDDIDTVLRLLDEVAMDADGAWLMDQVAYVEQPLRRDLTFDPARHRALPNAPVPFVIDEADTGIDAFDRAARLGYRGVSAKSCKGVFRALINRGVTSACGGFQTAEDLTTLPIHALHQDLALIATLGLPHAERNGHHYFRGLGHLGEHTIAAVLAGHGDLYCTFAGGARVAIDDGVIGVRSVLASGYGGRRSSGGDDLGAIPSR